MSLTRHIVPGNGHKQPSHVYQENRSISVEVSLTGETLDYWPTMAQLAPASDSSSTIGYESANKTSGSGFRVLSVPAIFCRPGKSPPPSCAPSNKNKIYSSRTLPPTWTATASGTTVHKFKNYRRFTDQKWTLQSDATKHILLFFKCPLLE